jgi:NADPH:quinone reductase
LIIAGYHQDGLRQVNLQQWNWRGIDVINAHERDPRVYARGVAAAADAAASRNLVAAPLYTHRFFLTEIESAFDHLRDRPEGFCKALVTYA